MLYPAELPGLGFDYGVSRKRDRRQMIRRSRKSRLFARTYPNGSSAGRCAGSINKMSMRGSPNSPHGFQITVRI